MEERSEYHLLQSLQLAQETGDEAILNLILETYYRAREREFQARFESNRKLLEHYAHYYGKDITSEIRYYPLWMGDNYLWYYDSVEKVFQNLERSFFQMEEPEDTVFLGKDLLWMEDVLRLEEMTRMMNPFMDMENPLLLFYAEDCWEMFLQLYDLSELVEMERILFYNDFEYLEKSLCEEQARFPSKWVGNGMEEISQVLNHASEKCQIQYQVYRNQALTYYRENADVVLRHIKEEKPKILFITSRFTTALQYHIRDCRAMAEGMGLETELLIEMNRLNPGISNFSATKKVAEFQPDMVFIIDHLRYEHSWAQGLDSLVWVCWVQDILPNLRSKEAPEKQTDRDVVINAFTSWKDFFDIGYDEKRLINYPLVCNSDIYHPYVLSEEEQKEYSCDICMVCHKSDSREYARSIANQFDGWTRGFVRDLYQSYINYVKETEQIFMTQEECMGYVNEFTRRHYGVCLKNDWIHKVVYEMRVGLKMRLYRERIADWLIDAGYTNIKLWGNGWADTEKYRPYAMGPAANGELLSKIYQASKIVLGNNALVTGAMRLAETLMSGGFYMSNSIPEEEDGSNFRQYLKEREEVVAFHDKEDFLKKVAFYLEDEEDRKRMAEIGHKKALEVLTYHSFMKNIIKRIAEMF